MNTVRPRSRVFVPEKTHSEALKACRDAYERKDYAKVIEIVNTILQISGTSLKPGQEIEILDFKCLSFVKLGELDTAGGIAKAMIRLDKCSGLGYCRIATIEKARMNYTVAVQFLDHGYTRVSEDDRYYSKLLSQRVALRELANHATTMSKATDPMAVLPLELLQLTLSYLDYRQIVAMTRVSKIWKRVLSRMEPINDTIDFRKSIKSITYPELRAALSRLQRPRRLAIDKLTSSAGEVLSKKLFHGPSWTTLEHLNLNDKKISIKYAPLDKLRLKTIHLGLDTRIETDEVFKIFGKCRLLKEAVFRRVGGASTTMAALHEQLEILELGNAFDLAAFSILPEHFSNFPNLLSLTVNGASISVRSSWDLRGNPRLLKLDTYACVIRSIFLPESLEQWLWDGTEVPCFNITSMLNPPPTPLPNLHTVCFSGENSLPALMFLQASKVATGQLRRAGLHNRQSGRTMTSDLDTLTMLREVEYFSFESESLTDQYSYDFNARYPNVATLQLAAPLITGAFIADLLRRPNNRISKLVLKDCGKIPRDAIDWARGQGVDVEVHLAKVEVRGGRRLREGWF